MPVISIDVTENISTKLMPLIQAMPGLLTDIVHEKLYQGIDLAREALESRVPVGATGEARSSVRGTQHVSMPDAGAFMQGQPGRAIVGYGAIGYEYYVEFGRGADGLPPEAPIVLWIEQTARGTAFLAEYLSNLRTGATWFPTLVQRAAFAIRRAHKRRGTRFYPPQPPPLALRRAYEETKPLIVDIFYSLPEEFVRLAAGIAQ